MKKSKETRPPLRLIPRDADKVPENTIEQTQVVLAFLMSPDALVTDDPSVLRLVWPTSPAPSVETLEQSIEQLVARRQLRRIYISGEAHLALPKNTTAFQHDFTALQAGVSSNLPTQTAILTQHTKNDIDTDKTASQTALLKQDQVVQSETPVSDPQSQNEIMELFRLGLAVDAEREKGLLLRVIVTLEVIVGLILFREALLWYFHL